MNLQQLIETLSEKLLSLWQTTREHQGKYAKVKAFLTSSTTEGYVLGLKRALELLPPKKYHKEFECNGAFGGHGCFEMFCEDQECRNAPKEYNACRTEIETALNEELKKHSV